MKRSARWVVAGLVGISAIAAGATALWPRPQASEVWQRARQNLVDGNFLEAQADLTKLGKIRKPTPIDWLLRAQVAMALNQIDDALDDLNNVPDDHQSASQARLQAGQLELRRNRARFAERYFVRATELNPKEVKPRRELIFILGFQLRRRDLMSQFQAMSQLTQLSYDDLFLWCLARGAEWEPTEAAAMLEKFVEADPDDRDSRLALAEDRRREQKYDEALTLLSALPVDDMKARLIEARIALDRNDEVKLKSILAAAPADDPDFARIRGRVAQIERRTDDAIALYRLALKAEPDDRDSLRGLGQCLSLKGESALADEYLEKAKKYDALASLVTRAAPGPGRADPQLVYDLSAACEGVGRYAEAVSWMQLILSRDPLDAKAQAAIFRIKALQQAANERKD